jgi:lipopolysaccharide export system protein LptA
MSIPPSNPGRGGAERSLRGTVALILALLLPAAPTFALSTDRNQPLDVRAQYQRMTQGRAGGSDTNFATLTGNVRMEQGSLKAQGDEAKLYDTTKGGTGGGDNQVRRMQLTGKPARLEQRMDGDGGLMKASAATIHYNTETGIAELDGDVVVVQEGRSEFRGAHMTYNTNTGAMEGGSDAPGSEIHLRFLPKSTPPSGSP